MAEHPTGTVTFLLTDIEGSTRLWDADPGRMADAVAAHDAIVRSAVDRHRGWVFSTAGDAFAASFWTVDDAIDAAIEVQRALARRGDSVEVLRVRMGIHTGVAHERGGDYFGPVVNRTARIMAAGHGGQVLLSGVAASLAQRRRLADLGSHRLKDVPEPQPIFQLMVDDLPERFPPLRAAGAARSNVPHLASSFLGRRDDVSATIALLERHRLVTLTGPGGVGKTRLALHVAAASRDSWPDGVWLVELASVSDGPSIVAAVTAALGALGDGTPDPLERVVSAIGERTVLLVMDNCEQVLDPVAELIAHILGRCPAVRVLATSREALGVESEQVWPVAALGTHDAASPAVALFLERATEALPSFEADDTETLEDIVALCRALDGLPLAIELAAARMVSMTPADVLDRLDDRLRWHTATRQDGTRHQTLSQVVAWSYDLLSVDEQLCLRRLSVFANGFGLSDAIAMFDLSAEALDVADIVGALVRKCLLTAKRSGRRVQYGLLETIRAFANEQLRQAGESAATQRRHADLMLHLAREHWATWDGPGYESAVAWFDENEGNLLAAFQWSWESGDVARAADLAAHATMLGFGLERHAPIVWSETVVDAARSADIEAAPRVLAAAGLSSFLGRPSSGAERARLALELSRDTRYESFEPTFMRMCTATALVNNGDVDAWLAACNDLADGPEPGRSMGRAGLLFMLPAAGRSREAAAFAADTLSGVRHHGNPFWIAYTLLGVGRTLADIEPAGSLRALREAAVYTDERRVAIWGRLVALELAGMEVLHGDLDEGIRLWAGVFDRRQRSHRAEQMGALARIMTVFEKLGHPSTAATLLGAVGPETPPWAPVDQASTRLREALGPHELAGCVQHGSGLLFADAAALACRELEHLRDRHTPVR